MGCDIHAAIEFRESADSPWQALLTPNEYFGKYGETQEFSADLNMNRNYDAFAILANVRNGGGFAGCDTGDGFAFISEPKGIPADVSTTVVETVLSDEHSGTWVSLQEILAFDWTRKSVHRGVVELAVFEEWDRVKEWSPIPKQYAGDMSGAGIYKVSNDEMRELLKGGGGEAVQGRPITTVEWSESYTDASGDLWSRVVPLMLKTGTQYGYDNVRLVMDFDS
jgi:hypothetical protein